MHLSQRDVMNVKLVCITLLGQYLAHSTCHVRVCEMHSSCGSCDQTSTQQTLRIWRLSVSESRLQRCSRGGFSVCGVDGEAEKCKGLRLGQKDKWAKRKEKKY